MTISNDINTAIVVATKMTEQRLKADLARQALTTFVGSAFNKTEQNFFGLSTEESKLLREAAMILDRVASNCYEWNMKTYLENLTEA